ncbi:helicase-exonuclease AddAB subunit AddB [Clostridium sp. WILCCON 0269]|uniref:ATP-dependent helicase/deoxyribonuclease subunit B n=1 Tax=Candidatus Clostridium eludens TaxID=3381663 RepID=A0ABW8SPD2_9CLOT
MSIRFIYGRAGSGKSYYCLEDMKRRVQEDSGRNLILLVPEQFSFQAEKNLIKSIGEKGTLKAQVLSFRRMAEKVFNEVGGGIRKHINDAGKNILLYKIIEENKNKLKVFKASARKQGFVNLVSDIIGELKKYNISSQLLEESLDRIENKNLRNKLQDIKIIFLEFENRLKKNYIDSDDILHILYEKLDKSGIFKNAEVWIDEFSSFTPQEYMVIEKIMCSAYRVNVTLCMDALGEYSQDLDLFLPTKITEQKLLEIAKENNITYHKPVNLRCSPCYRFKNSTALQHLQYALFSYPYRNYEKPTEDIEIFKALNKYTETEYIARDIVKTCRDKNLRFKDIAVVTGDLEGYENLIKAVFNQYDIPYFIDRKREIIHNPIVILIVSAVEILAKSWSYESVFRYLKTGLLDLEFEDIDILENYVLQNGIRGKQWMDTEPWSFRINYDNFNEEVSEEEEEHLSKINSIRDKVREPILRLSSTIKGKKKGKHICEGLYNFLCELKIPEKVEELITEFKYDHKLDRANEYSQIWDIVIDILDQIVDVIGDESFGMEIFNEVLITGFSQYEIGVIPPSLDQVLVSNITRIKSHNISALYIAGVNDGTFPVTISSDGIFTDKDRDELKERGLEMAPSIRSKAFEEQFLIYTTLTIVDKYLTLTYSISDEEGKAKRPSIVISMIKKLFPKLQEKNNVLDVAGDEEGIGAVNSPKATFNILISNIRKNLGNKESMNPLWIDVYRWYKEHKIWNKRLDTVLDGFYYNNEIEISDLVKVRRLYGKHLNMSVSRLEKFAQCPFGYFVQYGLKVKDRKMYSLRPPDLGSFMHGILEKFSVKLREENLTWENIDQKWCEKNVNDMVDTTLDSIPHSILNSSKRYKHITDKLKRTLTRSVWLITEHMKKGKFTPAAYELSFGESEDFPPILIKLASGEKVSLTGKVDRVDTSEDGVTTYIRIVDYKSGSKEFKLSDIYYGFQLQLLIYLDVILTEFSEKIKGEAIPAGVLYFKLDDPIIRTIGDIPDSEVEEKIVKSLKMNGLLLDDLDVIKQMDTNMEKNSDIISVSIKKDGSLSKAHSSLATKKQFELLRKYVRNTIAGLCEKILSGNIEVTPYKNKAQNGCSYCDYSAICQFDTSIRGNKYKVIKDKNDEEIWRNIENKFEQ